MNWGIHPGNFKCFAHVDELIYQMHKVRYQVGLEGLVNVVFLCSSMAGNGSSHSNGIS